MKKRMFLLFIVMMMAVSGFGQVQSPEEFFGFRLGSDYKLAGWNEIVTYFRLLDEGSDRVQVQELGKSTQGNPFILAVISSEENMKRIDDIRRGSRRIADPRGLNDEGGRALARKEKVIVLITCSLHATEVGAAQMVPELVYDLITEDTQENREILDNVVFVLVPSFNPDGLIMVKDWYDQYVETEFEGSYMPWLYQLYTGHDNNRDAFMLTQVESKMVNRILYHDWHPQIYLDMHQMGNSASRIFVPPFIDPLNPNVDPLVVWEINLMGEAMGMELEAQGKSGVGTSHYFTGWWEGAFMMNGWWHNIVGILTELASCKVASPVFQNKDDLQGGGRGFPAYRKMMTFPNPWPGGWWRLRDIVEYDYIAAKALLKTAAKYRESVLYNRYLMGKKAVENGVNEPPYAFLVPQDQKDVATTLKMIDVMMDGGVEVHRAAEPFTADGIPYPEGTYVILMAQPFRAYAKDLLERQEYPDIRESENGPPIRPYDVSGWSLGYQMGVRTIPVINTFDVMLEKVTHVEFGKTVLPGRTGYGYVLSPGENQSYIAVNRLLKKGVSVYRAADALSVNGLDMPPGAILVRSRDQRALQSAVNDLMFTVKTIRKSPEGKVYEIKPGRLGMYKPWMPAMHEGWSRWILEQYEFSYKNIHNEELRVGDLRERYDVIYIPDIWAEGVLKGREKGTVPPRYAEGIGAEGLTHLKKFVEAGGTLITMDSSSDLLIGEFGLPVANVLKDVKRKDFYCPGSILAMEYDISHPIAYGMEKEGIAFFARSPAFKVIPNFQVEAKVAAKYPAKHILKSGFLLGEEKIANKASIVEVPMGNGRVILIGFDAVNRAQAHVTFKILFNAILYGGAESTKL